MKPTTLQLYPELEFTAVRSRGPGGQNVNKVSSAALLKWKYLDSAILTDDQKARVTDKLSGHINVRDEIYIRSDEFRDLERNKARCMEKLDQLLKLAFHVPKTRRKTKPTKASRERRLTSKRRKSEIKKTRGKVRD